MPTPSQLEKINKLAKRPLSADDVFVFTSKMVGDMIIPGRFMQIHKSLLEVFKEDTKQGIAFMLDHSWAGFARPKPALTYGRSFDGIIRRGDAEGEKWALYGDFYIVRGREKDGISTDQIIADIEDGVLFDTSIGWGADTYECSICGNDYRNYRQCEHIAGRTYDDKLCYIIAKPPGFLMENSGVFDGAYPTAGILSADGSMSAETDLLVVEDLKSIRTGVPLINTYSAHKNKLVTFIKKEDIEKKTYVSVRDALVGVGIQTADEGRSDDMDVLKELGLDPEQVEKVDDKGILMKNGSHYCLVKAEKLELLGDIQEFVTLVESTDKTVQEIGEALQSIATLTQENAALKQENESLKPLAEDGKKYRQDLIEETLEWGVRAQGDKFDNETWKQLLSEDGRKLDTIKAFRDQFKEQAKEAIAAGKVTKFDEKKPEAQLDARAFKI